jgi:hypothetical protein
MKFEKHDVVRFDTGTTYIVIGAGTPLQVTSWRDRPYGATRLIDPARCTLVGRATRIGGPTGKGIWELTPAEEAPPSE